MWLLDWLSRSPAPEPRSYDEIKADVERRERRHLQRLNKTEQSLLSLTSEAGLEDLRHRLREITGNGHP